MSQKRKIAIFTGNRAEYGLQVPIVRAISEHPDLEYFLLVSGAHLQEDFGSTVKEIEKDGFRVYSEVNLNVGEDTLFSTVQSIGMGVLSLSKVLEEIAPDFHVVYADRFEGFSAVITSTQMGIPTAHIEGGDITEGGALDDSVRHAMTKLAHLHFTTNELAAERVRRLGEESWRVFNVGFPALDLVKLGNYASSDEIGSKFKMNMDKPILVFTQHSVTTEYDVADIQVMPSLKAMQTLAQKGIQIMITYPNNDAGGKRIIGEIERLKNQRVENLFFRKSLGRYFYHGFLNHCGLVGTGACVGNSSSGIKETPVFGCPTVNIGSRQDGRLRATNVIDTSYDEKEIIQACEKCLYDVDFRTQSENCHNPYDGGDSGKQVADVLATIEIDRRLVQKKMTF